MNDQYWGWILSVLGLIGFWLTGKKIWWAWWVNVAAQAVWYTYAIVTEQWGFLAMTTMYTFVFTKNAIAWTKEHRAENEGWDFNEYTFASEAQEEPLEKQPLAETTFAIHLMMHESEEEVKARVDAYIEDWIETLSEEEKQGSLTITEEDNPRFPDWRQITATITGYR